MLVLEEIVDLKEFKKVVYPEYKKLFPKVERKSYKLIKRLINKDILHIYKIINDNNFIGFMMLNSSKESKLALLDYFAIKKEYQGMGYGSKAINLLKESIKEYDYIFIEIEKLGLGKTDEENKLRVRRKKFYDNLGFYELKYDIELYSVIFTPLVLSISNIQKDENEIIKEILKIYNLIHDEKSINKHLKISDSDGKQLF